MVEIVRDHSTPPDPWWFLNPEVGRLAKPELVFVMQWLWHEKPAKEFLWDGAAGGRIRWHAEIEILEDDPVFKTRAGLLTFNTAVNRGLWHPDYFSMDWGASEGVYTGPAILLGRNPECPEPEGVFYDGRASVRITARLMRFHHGDVVRELCRRGLMPRPPVPPPSPATQEPSPSIPVTTEELQEERSAEDAIPPSAPVSKARKGKQERLLESIAGEIYKENMPLLLASEFQHAIEQALKTKTLTTPLPPHWVPELTACRRFLIKRNKLRVVR